MNRKDFIKNKPRPEGNFCPKCGSRIKNLCLKCETESLQKIADNNIRPIEYIEDNDPF